LGKWLETIYEERGHGANGKFLDRIYRIGLLFLCILKNPVNPV
jgi:hypothetical protein